MDHRSERPRLITTRNERLSGRRTRGRRLRRLLRGVYLVDADEPQLVHRCAAALVSAPADAVVVGITALWLHGVEVGAPQPIRLATTSALRRRTAGLRLARVQTLPPNRSRIALPVSAWLTACVELTLIDAVIAADRLLRLGRISITELSAAVATATGRGCRIARRAAALARPDVASPKETEVRLLLVLAGLPEPRCNVAVGDDVRRIAEVDLYYDAFRIVIEYEGDQHRTDGWQWSADVERYEALATAGYVVIRITAARLAQPRALVLAVHAQLLRRGYLGPVPTFTTDWRSLFESASPSGPNGH